jgi:hypothetical protein
LGATKSLLLTTLNIFAQIKEKKIWGKSSSCIKKFRIHRMQRHIKDFLIYEEMREYFNLI